MEILNNFGFEPILFVAQIVNFLIIYWLLKKFLYGSVLKLLEDRKVKIAKGLKDAHEAASLLESTIIKEEKILKEAQEKARQLLVDAKEQSSIMLKHSEEETKNKIEILLKEAREQIKYETGLAEKRIEANVGKLAVTFLEKSIKGLFGSHEQEVIMKTAMKKLTNKSNN